MYVRDGNPRDETWLFEQIDTLGLDTDACRLRDYVLAVDEKSNTRVGFGRRQMHAGDPAVCELTGIGVPEAWRGQGIGGHVIERLVAKAGDDGFETVYVLTDQTAYFTQFGFAEIEPDTTPDELPEQLVDRLDRKHQEVDESVEPLALAGDRFEMPPHLREAFKTATGAESTEPPETAEDFGVDPETATYKYDTG